MAEAMKAQGQNMSGLAEKLGIPRPTIVQIFNGKGDPGVSRIAAICRELGLTIDYVLTGRGGPDWVEALPVSLWGDGDASAVPFPKSWLHDEDDIPSLRLWRVRDDDMAPAILHRDWVMVDTSRTTPVEGTYLLNMTDKSGVRRDMVRRLAVFDQLLAVRDTLKNSEEVRFDYDQLGKPDGLILRGRVMWSGREIG